MGDLFKREKDLCILLMKNRQNNKISIEYFISNKSVDVLVFYKHKADWCVENRRQGINRLWKNFNLAFIGYKRDCLVLNYKARGPYVTEYTFPMHYFNIKNFHSAEFQKYESSY